jgi:hypothetical protein
MSNDTLFKIFISIAFGAISVLTVIGSIKEGKESLEKLNEHEALKQKRKEAQAQQDAQKMEGSVMSPTH